MHQKLSKAVAALRMKRRDVTSQLQTTERRLMRSFDLDGKDVIMGNAVKHAEVKELLEMAKQDIIPAVSDYVADLCTNVAAKQAVNDSIPCTTERDLIMKLSEGNDRLSALIFRLEDILSGIDMNEVVPASQAMAHKVIPIMEEMRTVIDGMEKITSSEYWPYPTYFDILYSVK